VSTILALVFTSTFFALFTSTIRYFIQSFWWILDDVIFPKFLDDFRMHWFSTLWLIRSKWEFPFHFISIFIRITFPFTWKL